MNGLSGTQRNLIRTAREEMQLTMGCTDPVGIAYSANTAIHQYCEENGVSHEEAVSSIQSIELELDKNLFKNASYARIPNTDGKGIRLALFLGLSLERPESPLLIFDMVTGNLVKRSEDLERSLPLNITIRHDKDHVFCSTTITFRDSKESVASLEYHHDTMVFRSCCENTLEQNPLYPESDQEISFQELPLDEVLSLIETIPLDQIEFIAGGFDHNMRAVGRGSDEIALSVFDQSSLIGHARRDIGQATLNRMNGLDVPIMACGGSGNHGITFFISLKYGSNLLSVDTPHLHHITLLGLYLLHVIKIRTGILTPMCGCAISSAMAVAASLVWAETHKEEKVVLSMNYILNTLAGLACDGAKPSCYLKTSLAGQIALESFLFTVRGGSLALDEGLSSPDFSSLLTIIEKIHTQGMAHFDDTVNEIIQGRRRQ